jgi:transposase
VLKSKGASKDGKTKRNSDRLPRHLPRLELVIEPEMTLCLCDCSEMAKKATM